MEEPVDMMMAMNDELQPMMESKSENNNKMEEAKQNLAMPTNPMGSMLGEQDVTLADMRSKCWAVVCILFWVAAVIYSIPIIVALAWETSH